MTAIEHGRSETVATPCLGNVPATPLVDLRVRVRDDTEAEILREATPSTPGRQLSICLINPRF